MQRDQEPYLLHPNTATSLSAVRPLGTLSFCMRSQAITIRNKRGTVFRPKSSPECTRRAGGAAVDVRKEPRVPPAPELILLYQRLDSKEAGVCPYPPPGAPILLDKKEAVAMDMAIDMAIEM
eukprot:440510-Pyramimonas_sp.AAC.1